MKCAQTRALAGLITGIQRERKLPLAHWIILFTSTSGLVLIAYLDAFRRNHHRLASLPSDPSADTVVSVAELGPETRSATK